MVQTISEKVNKKDNTTDYSERGKIKDTDEKSFNPIKKWRIWKNVVVLGFAFMTQFIAFWGASNLQSSVNASESLGTYTLAIIYGSLILTNMFLPTIAIKTFGCKWTIALSILTYMPFIASQLHPRLYTMIPSGFLVGFGGGPLWCAKCTYLLVLAEAYSERTGIALEYAVTRFFGVFFTFYQLSQVWGNLISYAVLSAGSNQIVPTTMNILNVTNLINDTHNSLLSNVFNKCGANFHFGVTAEDNPNLEPPPQYKIQLISGIYLACMMLACLCVIFGVDSLKRYDKNRTSCVYGLSGYKLLIVTVKHMFHPYQILISPIIMFIGAEQAFMTADYNASYVSCGWGVSNIGFVMICFGAANAISAMLAGGISKRIGRAPMTIFAFLLHTGLLITLLIWKPYSGNKIPFFVVAGLWGLCDAVWLVQINTLCGILFPGKEEAAYSNYRLWESIGAVITYVYSPYLRTNIKIYLLITLLIIGGGGCATIEILESKHKRNRINIAETNLEPNKEHINMK